MKKIGFIVIAASLILSCSKSDSNTSSSIDGTYKITSFTTYDPIDGNNDGNATRNYIDETGCYDNSTIILKPDNTALVRFQSAELELNQVAGTNQYQYTSTCNNAYSIDATWTKIDNDITITIEGKTEDFIISDNKLYYSLTDIVEYPTQTNGQILYKATGANLILTKQ